MADEPTVPDTEELTEQDSVDVNAEVLDTSGGGENLEALLKKANRDRSKANRAEVAAKKENEALLAKLAEYEERDKTELEKLADKAAKAEAALAAMAQAKTLAERKTALIAGGVDAPYLDFLAGELAKEQEAEPDLDVAEFIKAKEKTLSAMFSGNGNGSPASGQGGPATSGKPNKAAELQAVADRIHALQTSPQVRSDKVQAELQGLFQKIQTLRAELT